MSTSNATPVHQKSRAAAVSWLIVPAFACVLALTACTEHKPPATNEAAQPAAPSAAKQDGGAQRVLNFYDWADYIDPAVLTQFEKETGVHVRYDTFDSSEMLETKLLTGHTDYDVVVTSANILSRQVAAGALRKLDLDAIANRRNLDPALVALLDPSDPGGAHAVPYLLATTGIGLNLDQVEKRIPGGTPDSWRLVLDPKSAAKLADCGLAVLDSPTDTIANVLLYLGYDPDKADAAQMRAAEKVLMSIRPYVRYINSEKQVADLASGEICATIGWSGDIANARARAEAAGKPQRLRFVIPREGAISLSDMLAIPVDAPHVADAHRLIDYLLRADIGAQNANFVGYASPNLAAMPLIEERLRKDPGIYPPPAVKAKLHAMPARTLEMTRIETRLWTHFRMGTEPSG